MPLALTVGSLALTALVVAAAAAILNACALNFPFLQHLSVCKAPGGRAIEQSSEVLSVERAHIEKRLFELERELAALQCVGKPVGANRTLTPEGWAAGD